MNNKGDSTTTGAAAASAAATAATATEPRGKLRRARTFDHTRYPTHKVALRLAYHGHVHDGLAKQAEGDNTVEGVLCRALQRLRLVPPHGPTDLSRCGRTDKGVSALGNVIALTLRATASATTTAAAPDNAAAAATTTASSSLDYAAMLNHVLPPTVRVVGYALVNDAFDARFSCTRRSYRYYFAHTGLDVPAMRAAAAALVGTHNFRNFCKTDVVHVRSHVRHVYAADICPSEAMPHAVSYLCVTANSFLYHQIRCIMAVLLLIGRGCERVTVVRELLTRGDAKPQYALADATPLVLWECHYDTTTSTAEGEEKKTEEDSSSSDGHCRRGGSAVQWQLSPQAAAAVMYELQDITTALLLRATASDAMRRQLQRWYSNIDSGGSSSSNTHAATVVDAWTATGCDWTHERMHEQLKARRRDVLHLTRDRDCARCFTRVAVTATAAATRPPHNDDNNKNDATCTQPPSSSCGDSNKTCDDDGGDGVVVRYTPADYVPLLARPCERTYAQQVAELGGRKRVRYDANVAKANRHAAAVAAGAAAAEATAVCDAKDSDDDACE